MTKINEVLKEVLKKVKLSKKELKRITQETEEFINFLKSQIKKHKIKADVFVGGSYAKGTMVKKKIQEIDVFIRLHNIKQINKFSKIIPTRYKDFKIRKVHGSRDYFQFFGKRINFEVIPVKKISKLEEVENITDLSFLHVGYDKEKLKKNKRLVDEIILAKNFCHAQNCYGAESYISGFSGYALELLIIYYGSFVKMLKNLSKVKPGKKLIIDIEKHYKNKNDIMMNLNESKLLSPVILIDPTYKQRNVTAALSDETFNRFKISALKFLSNPDKKFFEKKQIDIKKFNFCLKIFTNKQEGAIAGSKLLKFHNFIKYKICRYFKIQKEIFEYEEGKEGLSCFKLKKIKEKIIEGPAITDIQNLVKFKKKHKKCFIKENRAYAKEKINIEPEEFLENFKKKYKKDIKAMGIIKIKRLR